MLLLHLVGLIMGVLPDYSFTEGTLVFAFDQLNRIGGCVRTLLSIHQGTIVASDAK
jgi:hypothetical protein